ncbi:MAG: cation diffusion facilitator family transporter, partial [Chitinivibrionales bacterium]
GMFLMAATGVIFYESVKRLIAPEHVESTEMFVIAIIGLAVNILTIIILEGSRKEDRNIRAAFMHMIADALSSVAVVLGAVVIHFTGFYLIDPLIGILISILIVTWAWGVIKDSGRVLLEMTPKGTDTDTITEAVLQADSRIHGIVDMHVVEITNGMYDFSAHIVYDCKTLQEVASISEKIREVLAQRFKINHATIEPVIEGGTVMSAGNCRPTSDE